MSASSRTQDATVAAVPDGSKAGPTVLEALRMALAAQDAGDAARAEMLCRAVLAVAPRRPDALTLLGSLRARAGHPEEAAALHRAAIAAAPDYPDAHHNLGNMFFAEGDTQGALDCYLRASALRPDWPEGCNRVAATLHALGRFDEADAWFERALALRPESADFRWDRALALLAAGRYAEGWCGFEARRLRGQPPPRDLPAPYWDGSPIDGRRMLVYSEQGHGDAIQFLRFLEPLRRHGARSTLELDASLVPLVDPRAWGLEAVVPSGGSPRGCDVHVSLLSLPLLLEIGARELMGDRAYLSAPPLRTEAWRRRLPAHGLRVGLAWSGNPDVQRDRWRSPRLAPLLPILDVPGVRFFGLQKGDGERDAVGLARTNFTPLGKDIGDFADTAAIMTCLDLVVTSDTSVAHLAGALGKPTWVLLHATPDWRWGHAGVTTPWYATMRLYRQDRLGDWSTPVGAIVHDLSMLAGRRGDGADRQASATGRPGERAFPALPHQAT